MKKIMKHLAVLLCAVMICTCLPAATSMKAKAAGTTYSVAYIGGTYNEWRYQPLNVFEEAKGHGTIGELNGLLKDGDTVVIYNAGVSSTDVLDLSTKNLGNITITNNVTAVVKVASVTDLYILADTVVSFNGKVTNATVYDSSIVTFQEEVTNLTLALLEDRSLSNTSIQILKPVSFFQTTNYSGNQLKAFYNVTPNQLIFKDGYYNMPEGTYSLTPSQTAATTTTTATASNANDLDKVPKTGDSNVVVYLLGASAVLMLGSVLLRRKEA